MSARGAIVAVTLAVGASVLAACGGGGGGATSAPPSSRPTTPTSTSASTPRAIERREAEAEAASAAAQDAVRQDYSIPPTAFAVRCAAAGDAASARRWTCATRSRDGRCRGTVGLVVLVDGSTQPRGALVCRGPTG